MKQHFTTKSNVYQMTTDININESRGNVAGDVYRATSSTNNK